MQKSTVFSFATAVTISLLVFLFFTTYYFAGVATTSRPETVNQTQCNCHHLNGTTVLKENEGAEVTKDDLKFTVNFFHTIKTEGKKGEFSLMFIIDKV